MTDPDTSRAPQPKFEEVAIDGATPAERISGVARWVVVITTLLSLVLVVNQLFNLQLFGIVLIDEVNNRPIESHHSFRSVMSHTPMHKYR